MDIAEGKYLISIIHYLVFLWSSIEGFNKGTYLVFIVEYLVFAKGVSV